MHTSMHTITQAHDARTDIYTHRNTETQTQMKPSPVYSLTILFQLAGAQRNWSLECVDTYTEDAELGVSFYAK